MRACAASRLADAAGTAPRPVQAADARLAAYELRMSEAQDLLHRTTGLFGVAFLDGVRDVGMVGDVVLEPAVDAIDGVDEYRAQNRVDRTAKALQHRVVRRIQDRKMERLVRGR